MQRLALAWLVILLALTACNRTESIGPSLEPSPAPPAALQSAPLADAGSPISHTASLFERLDATSVGIDFVHEWKPRNPYEANLLKTPFTGGGVAMGDYDGDGLCDVALTRPHGGLRLYRNRGDFKFEDVTEAAGVASNDRWTTGITFADVNHDGKLDLAVCSFDGANLLFMNQGGGRFQNQAHDHGLHFVGASVKMAFADYDRDGDLDAYLLTNRYEQRREVNVRYLGTPGHYTVAPEFQEMVGVINLPNGEQKFTKAAQADRLYHNDLRETGKLSFRDVTPRSGLHGFDHGLDITWWDFNQDGYPDIYIANDFTDPDRFYRNNGNGTFTEISQEALPSTPWFAMGSATGDINNDGQFDLLATDMAGTTHYRQKMAMGSMEAVAWFLDTAEPRQHMRNSLFLNTGTSRFLEVAQMTGLASTDWTWSVKLADLDLDGKEDVYITNGFTRDYLNSDFNLQLRSKGQEGNSLAWYDAPELREANLAFRNQGNMRFVNTAKAWGLDEVGISFGAALGDLDGDGDQDLVVINFSGPPSVYRNRSTASRVQVTLRGTRSNAEGIGAIVQAKSASTSQTRYVHPGNGFMSSNDSNLTIGLGSDEAIETLTVRWPSGATQQVANVRANQRITLAEPSAPSPPTTTPTSNTPDRPSPLFQDSSLLKHARHIERPYDDYVREPLLPNKLSQLGPGMAWADVDGDGDVDVYLGGAAGQSGQIFLQEEGRFDRAITTPFQQHAESEDMGCLFLDADCDGDLDLFVVSGGVESDAGVRDYQDRLYLQIDSDESGRPQWESRPERVPEEFDSGGPVAAADFDRDGDLDLFIGGRVVPGAYPTSPTSHLWRNDNGTFVEVTNELAPELVTPGMVTSCLWSDVDGDGWIDLLLATEYGPVRTFRNEKGQLRETTADAKLADMTGWWNSLAAADVDRDGDMDYLATNLGTNTKYHPSPEHPQVVFYGDFDNSGKRQIVEAKQTDSGLLPLRGRSCSSNAMPFLAKKFASYHAFASATLTDIYTESNLKNALRFEAVLAVTVMLINDGQGRFTSHVLPDLAQVSPGMGVQFLWANADEYPDLFIAQNFYSPQRETGRMNGGMGVLLLGNEAGSFSEVWPSQSGIIIPEDARSAAVVDLNQDGWQDVAVATNNGAPRLLLHKEMPADTPPMRLDCKGRLGNPTGVGVRVVTTTKSGRREVFETHAGGGYLTQAPTSIYVMSKPDDPAVSLTVRWPEGQQQIVPLSDPLSTIRVIEQP